MFQDELIRAMGEAGMAPAVLSLEPMPAFPRSRRLLARRGLETLRSGHRTRLLSYLNVHPIKTLSGGLSVFVALVLWAWRNRGRRRVMFVVNLTMPPGAFVWAAARLTRSRAMVAALDVWKPGGIVPDTLARRVDFSIQRRLLPRFDGHMVVSRAISDDLIPGRSVCVLEGGVATDRVQSVRPHTTSGGSRPFRLVLAGTLETFNGLELVAGAMRLLPSDYELVVAGAGPLAERARELANRDPRVTYRGLVSFEEVLELYASADLLLNARLTQALDTRYFFPSKLMELLASGTPVLSTCTGQVESEYGDVLYLLRTETPEALADRIREIRQIEPETRRVLGQRARAFMLQEKSWTRQGERLVAYIQSEVIGA
jgi:glycosyltransferase involved in cell wall biosynthesis